MGRLSKGSFGGDRINRSFFKNISSETVLPADRSAGFLYAAGTDVKKHI